MSNALKDIQYYANMAGALDAAHAIGDAVADTYREGVTRAGGHAMVPELVSALESASSAG